MSGNKLHCSKCKSELIVGTPWGEFRCVICNNKGTEQMVYSIETYEPEPFDPDNEMPLYNEDEQEQQ